MGNNKEFDTIADQNLAKLSTKGKVNLQNLDANNTKGHGRVSANDPIEKPKMSKKEF